MKTESVIFSIKPRYAEKIFEGEKKVELRKTRPQRLKEGSFVLVYASSPLSILYGIFRVKKIEELPTKKIRNKINKIACVDIDFFDEYYRYSKTCVLIHVGETWLLSDFLSTKELSKFQKSFYPPQSFRYAKRNESKFLETTLSKIL